MQLIGLIGFISLSVATGEPAPHPTPAAWKAVTYLILAGSLLGFTAYLYALHHLPLPIVMTYAYVNPLIALALGWWLLDEVITVRTGLGAALILMGVAGVFRVRRRRPVIPVSAADGA